nr:MAG: NinG protein [Bacteriophage sp.]
MVAVKEYAKDFYKSDAWKKARVAVIKRANGLCERCRAAGQYKPGVIVHHKKYITPGNIHDARVTLDLNNLEYVCEDCHNKEHKAKPNSRYTFDAKGNLLPPKENKQQTTPPGTLFLTGKKEPREIPQKNSARSHAYEGGLKFDRRYKN